MHELFRRLAAKISMAVGSYWAFTFALFIIIIWLVNGPVFGFSDTWQLVINTGTTIVTFLMVFLIQNTQNRDSKVTHLKLDELIYASKKAKDKFIDTEKLTDEELNKLRIELDGELSKRKHQT